MLKKFILFSVVMAFTITTALGIWVVNCQTFLERTYITYNLKIEQNEPFYKVYDKLFKYLKTPVFFKQYLIKIEHFDKKIKYGAYKFENLQLKKALQYIAEGKTNLIKVTIPEGYNIYDIAKILDNSNIIRYEKFIEKVFDKDYVYKTIGFQAESLEGFLYPETYFFEENTEPEAVVSKMYNTFMQNLPDNFSSKASANGLTFYQAVILASIIQKESYDKDEMPVISSVFHNRLKIKMRLESDPTIIYGIYSSFDGNLKKSDLANPDNRYNTYKINGLPPTPICNPESFALYAAVNPTNTDYLYFVADKEGKHQFSKSYNEHKNKVYRFQKR